MLLAVKAEYGNHGNHNMLNLVQHINETQFAMDNHYLDLIK